jgi:NAD(P)-dependent dehydrogenase (short-subunit alcohol dehydrogenase family)
MLDFRDARVLVVGGGSGIGLAVAAAAAGQGARVVIAGRSEARLLTAAEGLVGQVEARVLDATDAEAVEAFFAAGQTYDHAVVTAAAFRSAPVRELPLEMARAVFESKFWASYNVARAAAIAPDGSLTLVSGVASVRFSRGRAVVSAAAAAVEALTRGLALELSPIRVNCVSPGMVDTPMLRAARAPGGAEQVARERTPVGRLGRPQEIALQVLACMGNRFMTGSVVYLDGGYTLA